MGQTMATIEAKEGGHWSCNPHCKEMMAKPVMDATAEGGGSNNEGMRMKKGVTMWFVPSLF